LSFAFFQISQFLCATTIFIPEWLIRPSISPHKAQPEWSSGVLVRNMSPALGVFIAGLRRHRPKVKLCMQPFCALVALLY
jgi:hypothetical protein